ncbi:cx9C motif-containing protein 4 [Mixophyes fleayi]|uniref:cx9C motif-containing protein 4 n=1 Tax=Mixophyes fleayi TaxID=3061075 RepID=UPI003F4D9A44
MSQRKDPCQKAACTIQKCLQVNNYMESKCEHEFQAMRNCCSKLVTQNSVCCSGFYKQQPTKEEPEVQGVSEHGTKQDCFL